MGRIIPFAILSCTLLVGCATVPSQEQIDTAYYGDFVDYVECSETAQKFIRARLKDPNSAQFSDIECYQGWEEKVPLLGLKPVFGYRFVGKVNGKNSFGGYTGFRQFSGIMRKMGPYSPRVVRYCISDNSGLCISRMAQ